MSEKTKQAVQVLFPDRVDEVCDLLLHHLDNEPSPGAADERERIRLAALKVSEGKMDKLKAALALAKKDFRDILMWADFGDPMAHARWVPEPCG